MKKKTTDGTIIYRTVISLTEDDAMRLGYDEREKWEQLIETKAPDIANKLGIKIENLEYVSAVHFDKGHPHVHSVFWDKNQGVKRPFVHESVSNSIRIDLTKYIFEDELYNIKLIKNEARKSVTTGVGGFFDGFLDDFAKTTKAEYKKAVSELKKEDDLAKSKLIYNRFNTKFITELTDEMLELKVKLPKRGRLNMQFLEPELKEEVHKFVLKILDENVDCNREFQLYIQSCVDQSKYYSNNPDKHKETAKKAYDDIILRLSNVVLKNMKELNKLESSLNREVYKDNHHKQMVRNLVTEMFSLLSRASEAEENKYNSIRQVGDLSKQAKKELAIKLENKSNIDWER